MVLGFHRALVLATAALLFACGGGGSGGGDAAAPGANGDAKSFPLQSPANGDFAVFQWNQVNTASTVEFNYVSVANYDKVAANGAFNETALGSESGGFSITDMSADGSSTAFRTSFDNCTYGKPYRLTPPPGVAVGGTYRIDTDQICGPATTRIAVNGRFESLESLTIPLGTFSTAKYSATVDTTEGGTTYRSTQSCWVDTVTGLNVKCISVLTESTNVNTTTWMLDSYRHHGQAFNLNTKRFVGFWFVKAPPGPCPTYMFRVAADGTFYGTCTGAPMITGTVDSAGVLKANGGSGSALVQLNGTLTTPLAGSGVWTVNGVTGTWTASRL